MTNGVCINKIYNVYEPIHHKKIDSVKVTEIHGSLFSGYSIYLKYEVAYDLSDSIIIEEVEE